MLNTLLSTVAAFLVALTLCAAPLTLDVEEAHAAPVAPAVPAASVADAEPVSPGASAVYNVPVVRNTLAAVNLQATSTNYVTPEQGAQLIKQAMANREPRVSFTIATDENFEAYADQMFEAAFEEDDNPMHGDYLRWVYDSMEVGMSGYFRWSTYYITYTYDFAYKTTAEQERQVLAAAKDVLADLEATKDMSSDEKKLRAIYDYICGHVTYDYANVNNPANRLQYTAYAALINGKAVCQGYASLLYLMARLEGVPVRIVAGNAVRDDGQTEAHAWNIVGLGTAYYNVDVTWDKAYYDLGMDYRFYLKSDADFSDRTRGVDGTGTLDFSTQEFYAKYPMALVSYQPSSAVEEEQTCEHLGHVAGDAKRENKVAPTCEEDGSYDEVVRCDRCAEVISKKHVVVKALGHEAGKAVHEDEVEATCDEPGSYDEVTYCTRCDEELSSKHVTVAATGHSWDEWELVKDSTVSELGLERRVCLHDDTHVQLCAVPKKLSIARAVIGGVSARTYTGNAIKPALTVAYAGKMLKVGTDYTVKYAKNTNAGTATATVTGKGDYSGVKKVTFKIAKAKVSKASFSKVEAQKLKKKGQAVKPKVTVKFNKKTLKAKKDYTITYKNNEKKGTASIIIKGKGNFTGSKTIKFKIK